MVKITQQQVGGTLVCQAGYHLCKRTFKTHPKRIFRDDNRPYKYVFLHAFFLICPPVSKICQYDQKHTLLFSGMNIDPINMCFCACGFLNLSAMSFPKFVNMTKNTPPFFSPILHVFALLNNVLAYIAWSWKTTLITFFFRGLGYIQLQIQVFPPPPGHASRVTKRPYPDSRPMQ